MAAWNDTVATWNSASATWDSSGAPPIFPTAIGASTSSGVAAPRLSGWLLKGATASTPSTIAYHLKARPSAIGSLIGIAVLPVAVKEIDRSPTVGACASTGVASPRLMGWLIKGAASGASANVTGLRSRPIAIGSVVTSSSFAAPVKEICEPSPHGSAISSIFLAVHIRLSFSGIGVVSGAAVWRLMCGPSSITAASSSGIGHGEVVYRHSTVASCVTSGLTTLRLTVLPEPFALSSCLASVVVGIRSKAIASAVSVVSINPGLCTRALSSTTAHGSAVVFLHLGVRGAYGGNGISSAVAAGRLISRTSATGTCQSGSAKNTELVCRPISHSSIIGSGSVAPPTNVLYRPTGRGSGVTTGAISALLVKRAGPITVSASSIGIENANPAVENFTLSVTSTCTVLANSRRAIRSNPTTFGTSGALVHQRIISRPNSVSIASGTVRVIIETFGITRPVALSSSISVAVVRCRIRSAVNTLSSTSASASGLREILEKTIRGGAASNVFLLLRIGGNVVEKALASCVGTGVVTYEIGPLISSFSASSGITTERIAQAPRVIASSVSAGATGSSVKAGVFRPNIAALCKGGGISFNRNVVERVCSASSASSSIVINRLIYYPVAIVIATGSGVASKANTLTSPVSSASRALGRVNSNFATRITQRTGSGSGSVVLNVQLVYRPLSVSEGIGLGFTAKDMHGGLTLPKAIGSCVGSVSAVAKRSFFPTARVRSGGTSSSGPRYPYRAHSIVNISSGSSVRLRPNQRLSLASFVSTYSNIYTLNNMFRPGAGGSSATSSLILFETNQTMFGGGNASSLVMVTIGAPTAEVVVLSPGAFLNEETS